MTQDSGRHSRESGNPVDNIIDSRFRGNDGVIRGNDGVIRGNDGAIRGNDVGKSINDVLTIASSLTQ